MRNGGQPQWWMIAASAALGAVVSGVLVLALVIGVPGVRSETPAPAPAATEEAGDPPSVTIVGDSWSVGAGASALHGFADLAPEQLGWAYRVLAHGGSGFARPGPGSTYDQRVERAVYGDPDVLVVQGSVNDRDVPEGELASAATRTLTRLATAAAGGTEIVVLGVAPAPAMTPESVKRLNGVLSRAAADAGVTFVDPAAEGWMDPDAPWLWADHLHRSDLGHQVLAGHLKAVLAAALES